MTLSQAVEFFTQHARIYGRSRKTLSMYDWVFQTLFKYLRDDRDLPSLSVGMVRGYFDHLITDLAYRPSSVGMHYRVLHAFFGWTVRDGMIRTSPLEGIPTPKEPKLFPFMLNDAQVAALLKTCSKDTKNGVRDYAILLLFLDCGLRLCELVSLRVTDVSFSQRSLKVHGKGVKDRIVYMGARTTKALRRWIEIRGFKSEHSDAFFLDRKGEALKPDWVQEVIARMGKRAGLKLKLSPHKLRHVSSTRAVKNGMDAFTLQRLYGWENFRRRCVMLTRRHGTT